MFGLIRWLRGTNRKPRRKSRSLDEPFDDPSGHAEQELADMVRRLVQKAWRWREDNKNRNLILNPDTVSGANSNEAFVTALLKHVRSVAPGLDVPFMTPLVVVSNMEGSGGEFVQEDGWVRIVVGSKFAANLTASRAILCHELCHYILSANGIRLRDRKSNERLTDTAMFVFGIGDVFLNGYRTGKTQPNRSGHRLGYLTDAEYQFVKREVSRLYKTGESQPGMQQELLKKLRNRLGGDDRKLERYLAHARVRFPTMTDTGRIQAILDDFDRGR